MSKGNKTGSDLTGGGCSYSLETVYRTSALQASDTVTDLYECFF